MTEFLKKYKKILFLLTVLFSSLMAFLPIEFPNNVSDKLLHFFAFMCLTIVGLKTFRKVKLLVSSLILYGIFIEIFQIFIPNRTPSFLDLAGDVSGIFTGLLFYFII